MILLVFLKWIHLEKNIKRIFQQFQVLGLTRSWKMHLKLNKPNMVKIEPEDGLVSQRKIKIYEI